VNYVEDENCVRLVDTNGKYRGVDTYSLKFIKHFYKAYKDFEIKGLEYMDNSEIEQDDIYTVYYNGNDIYSKVKPTDLWVACDCLNTLFVYNFKDELQYEIPLDIKNQSITIKKITLDSKKLTIYYEYQAIENTFTGTVSYKLLGNGKYETDDYVYVDNKKYLRQNSIENAMKMLSDLGIEVKELKYNEHCFYQDKDRIYNRLYGKECKNVYLVAKDKILVYDSSEEDIDEAKCIYSC
jgi:hypothetical protein